MSAARSLAAPFRGDPTQVAARVIFLSSTREGRLILVCHGMHIAWRRVRTERRACAPSKSIRFCGRLAQRILRARGADGAHDGSLHHGRHARKRADLRAHRVHGSQHRCESFFFNERITLDYFQGGCNFSLRHTMHKSYLRAPQLRNLPTYLLMANQKRSIFNSVGFYFILNTISGSQGISKFSELSWIPTYLASCCHKIFHPPALMQI